MMLRLLKVTSLGICSFIVTMIGLRGILKSAGDIEVQQSNDDIPVPAVPEPATLALLGFGTVLSLRRKK
ncbi:MAG: PEP-CTERM sorting domain-containing protein [Planctomycetota bacterium]